jgi:hypothetical protein
MRRLVILVLHLITTMLRVVRPGGVRTVVAESVLAQTSVLILNRPRRSSAKPWHIKKDPVSCLAGEGGIVEEIVCRSCLQTLPKLHRFKERSRNWGDADFYKTERCRDTMGIGLVGFLGFGERRLSLEEFILLKPILGITFQDLFPGGPDDRFIDVSDVDIEITPQVWVLSSSLKKAAELACCLPHPLKLGS